MNDSLRDNSAGPPTAGSNGPAPVLTAAAATPCPQCGTQLRLLSQANLQTPIACCICGTTFYLRPVETAPLAEIPARGTGSYTGRPASGSRPAFRVISPPGDGRQPRPAERGPRSPDDPPPSLTTPAPPPPSPGTRAAPGMPKPVELPDHVQRGFRTGWMESVLGAVLILLLIVAVCAGAFFVARYFWDKHLRSKQHSAEATATADTSATADGKLPPAPAAVPAPVVGPAKALPRPEALFGAWESRVDDGSQSSFVFRADGTVLVGQVGDPPPPPTQANWSLMDRKGDEMVIDIGGDFGTMGNRRMTLRLTAPDAFTLVKSIRYGIVQPEADLRYVRVGPAVPEPPAAKPQPAPLPAAKPPEPDGAPAPPK